MDTNGRRRTNKRWPEALKRKIVAATYEPGASVSVVARQYEVNANQVFGWRRRYGPDVTAAEAEPKSPRPRMVELTVAREAAGPEPMLAASAAKEVIEIEVAGAYRVRVGANFDGRALRRLLDLLVRR